MKSRTAILLILGSLSTSAGAATIDLKVLPPTVRVRQEGAFTGAEAVEIFAARGEVESFQVVVTAAGENLRGISAEISSLQGPGGAALPAQNVTLYREVFIPVRYSSPQATEPPGLVADPLIPFVNPYTNEPVREPRWRDKGLEGGRFGAVGFDLWQDRHQPLWVDVQIPGDAAPGVYTGTFAVRAQNAPRTTIPVRVTVWDFRLPAGPTHENEFGSFSYVMRYYKLDGDAPQFRILNFTMLQAYAQMMPYHFCVSIGHPGRDFRMLICDIKTHRESVLG